jgi:2-(1,2-epoxy-1,2-dihydrophenyl)acetyl-CoA isomerase
MPRMPAYEVAHEYQTVRLHRAGAAARIELNRPEALNAWNQQLGHDLLAAVEAVADDPGVRAVEVRGAGRAFSSGADLKGGFDLTADGTPDVQRILEERYHPIITGLRRMPKPAVAAVQGPAAGIGCSLALACDLVVVAEDAYFLLAFVNIGLVPDGGSSLLVPARVGFARAAQMALLGERVPGREAERWGLANACVPAAELDAHVAALVDRLAAGPTGAYAGAKRELNAWLYARMDEQLALEAAEQQACAASPDFREGVAAFAEKRAPRFVGA